MYKKTAWKEKPEDSLKPMTNWNPNMNRQEENLKKSSILKFKKEAAMSVGIYDVAGQTATCRSINVPPIHELRIRKRPHIHPPRACRKA